MTDLFIQFNVLVLSGKATNVTYWIHKDTLLYFEEDLVVNHTKFSVIFMVRCIQYVV